MLVFKPAEHGHVSQGLANATQVPAHRAPSQRGCGEEEEVSASAAAELRHALEGAAAERQAVVMKVRRALVG